MKRIIKFIKVTFTVFLLIIQTINATAQSCTVDLQGQHHVCDIDNAANTIIYAYIDGTLGLQYLQNPDYYHWYLDGNLLSNGFIYMSGSPQIFMAYLEYSSQPYTIKLNFVIEDAGCDIWDEFLVYVHPIPQVVITANNNEFCVGGTTTLTANVSGAEINDCTFQWYKDEVLWNNQIPGAILQSYTSQITVAGEHTYWVVVERNDTFNSNDENGNLCRVEESHTIIVHPKPVIEEITVSETNICQSGQVTVTAIPSENNFGNNPVYTWRKNGSIFVSPSDDYFTEDLSTINNVVNYTYNATVTYENAGCVSVLDPLLAKTVTVHPLPTVSISGTNEICNTTVLTYLQAMVGSTTTTVTYQWYLGGSPLIGQTESSINIVDYVYVRPNPFIFEVEITDYISGCVVKSSAHSLNTPYYSYDDDNNSKWEPAFHDVNVHMHLLGAGIFMGYSPVWHVNKKTAVGINIDVGIKTYYMRLIKSGYYEIEKINFLSMQKILLPLNFDFGLVVKF